MITSHEIHKVGAPKDPAHTWDLERIPEVLPKDYVRATVKLPELLSMSGRSQMS